MVLQKDITEYNAWDICLWDMKIMKRNDYEKPRIVVIGGGFAGLNFIKHLSSSDFEVTLVDKNNFNYFTPLLYQVATGFLEPSSISYPLRKLVNTKGFNFRQGELCSIDSDNSRIKLTDGDELEYDHLVIAAGTKTNFFGNANIQEKAFELKEISDALSMRNALIRILERASVESDPNVRAKLLTIVIAGGGPTGVEVAGMLAEMNEQIVGEDYPELEEERLEIHIVDGGPHLLAPMSDKSHRAAFDVLTRLDVHVHLNELVKRFEDDTVYLSSGNTIESATLIWSAGVVANSFDGIAPQVIGKGKRLLTDGFNKVSGYDNVYAIGDISIQFTDPVYPNGHPQLAQPAIQQGKTLAKNLNALVKGKRQKAFKYFDRGDMAIIGKGYAVADLFKHKLHLGGLLGLLAWLLIHVISLVNYNNKVKTLYNWAIAYLTSDPSLRMIFQPNGKQHNFKPQPEPLTEGLGKKSQVA
ncbi:MAG: NAD(P)/FAD-dependent oxidoreductase [Chryseolinea sp.]